MPTAHTKKIPQAMRDFLGRRIKLAVELSLSGEEADALHEAIVQIKT